MHDTCPYCNARYERGHGEGVGGLYINIALAEFTALSGFFIVDALTDIEPIVQLLFWIPYILIFCALLHRHARGIWVGIVYLTGGVYPDPDYMREYFRSENEPAPHSAEHE
jgi:uncharacterized protein (DUF983 family)